MSQFDPISGREAEPADPLASSRPAWHGAAPSVELATALFEIEERGTDALDDYALVELVAAAQRLSSWAHHLAASAAGALSDRESMEPPAAGMVTRSLTAERLAGEEVAMRLGWTPRAGQRLVEEGRHYRTHLVEVRRCGVGIDPTRRGSARRSPRCHGNWPRRPGDRARMRRGAPGVPRATHAPRSSTDPHEAQERRERATKDRYHRPPLPDGMAGCTDHGPDEGTADAVDAGLVRPPAGDPRTLEQRGQTSCRRRVRRSTRREPRRSPGSGAAPRCGPTCACSYRDRQGTSEDPGFLEGYGTIDPSTRERSHAAGRGAGSSPTPRRRCSTSAAPATRRPQT